MAIPSTSDSPQVAPSTGAQAESTGFHPAERTGINAADIAAAVEVSGTCNEVGLAKEAVGGPPRQLKSRQLLKFEEGTDRPMLVADGIEMLQSLPGPVCPIAFVGDGRSGKSYLASLLCGEDAFETDDSATAVTKGIDIFVIPSHPGHLVVLDCEGGNNAMSESHTIVTVVGALIATALVFVTDGKASEAAIEALAHMLEERSLIKCDGTGSLHAQTLLFVVNQNRLRYDENALETILSMRSDKMAGGLRELIANAYPENRRQFLTIPPDNKKDFQEKWMELRKAIDQAACPLKMGKLWMTGGQVKGMLERIEMELRHHGRVSLPSLHRHVILDSWLKPKVGQILASGLHNLTAEAGNELLQQHKVGSVEGDCQECKAVAVKGWQDPDVDDFFCEQCWQAFSPKVLKCGFCNGFQPWALGRVEQVTKMWHCIDCLMQLGINVE